MLAKAIFKANGCGTLSSASLRSRPQGSARFEIAGCKSKVHNLSWQAVLQPSCLLSCLVIRMIREHDKVCGTNNKTISYMLLRHMSLRFRRAQSLWACLFASKITRTTGYDALEPSRLETDASPENSKYANSSSEHSVPLICHVWKTEN